MCKTCNAFFQVKFQNVFNLKCVTYKVEIESAQANYECDPGYEISRTDEDDHRQRDRSSDFGRPRPVSALVRSANRVCSQSGIWLPEERIQCVKTRWAANSLF